VAVAVWALAALDVAPNAAFLEALQNRAVETAGEFRSAVERRGNKF